MKTRMIAVALMLGVCGCMSLRYPHDEGRRYQETVVSLEPDLAWFEVSGLGPELQTVGVHPADAGFLSGETTTNLTGGSDGILRLGLEQQIGSEQWRFKGGLDARIRTPWFNDDDRYYGFYDVAKQSSDTRPNSHAAFVYTTVNWQPVSVIPHLGVERHWVLSESFSLHWALEAGLPYGGFELEAGHDRFGKWSPVRTEKWTGLGQRYATEIGVVSDIFYQLTIGVAWERYQAEFAGDDTMIQGSSLYFRIFGN